MDNMQPPITSPQRVPVQQYVYIATIQRYPVSQQGISTPLTQPPPISPGLPPHMFPAAGQHHIPARSFYIQPPDMPRYAARQHRPDKARSEGPGVGETLLGCGMLLVAGILVLMLLYYLSAAR
jgi:hypothetical protein